MVKHLPFFFLLFFSVTAFGQHLEEYILRANEHAADEVSKNTFITASADRRSCYTGEHVVITYKYYTRLKTEVNVTHYPSYSGLSIIDLNERNQQTIERVNNRDYNVYIIHKVQGYPLQAGNLEIEPLEMDITAWFIKEEYYKSQNMQPEQVRDFDPDKYENASMAQQRVTVKSKAISLTVLELPVKQQPQGFKGAVGNYAIITSVEKKAMHAGEKNTFSVTVTGRGNMHLLNAPEISFPEKIELFEPIVKEELNNYTIPVAGKKTFHFPFVINDTGNFLLPAVSFSYFNVSNKQFNTASSKPLMLTVTKAVYTKPVFITEQKEEKSWMAKMFSSRVKVIFTVAILILTGLLIWIKQDKKREAILKKEAEKKRLLQMQQQQKEQALLNEMKNPLETSLNNLLQQDKSLFIKNLHREYKGFLAKKMNILSYNLSNKTLGDKMDELQYSTDTTSEAVQTLEQIEFYLFTPGTENAEMEMLYEKAAGVIARLRNV